jgi:biopolymer transport protein ExbD
LRGASPSTPQPITDEDYVPRLKSLLGGRPAGQKLLFFTPDAQARYERLVVALSGAKEAGAETLRRVMRGAGECRLRAPLP